MPAEYKGACCGGTKAHGDGNGRRTSNGEVYYLCHGCWKELGPETRIERNKQRALAIKAAKEAEKAADAAGEVEE